MPTLRRPSPIVAALLAMLSLILVASVVIPLFPGIVLCPNCLGQGLTVEPPGHGTTRWVGRTDELLPLECACCGNRGKISLMNRWLWKETTPIAPPIYRGDPRKAFAEQRSLRMHRLQLDAVQGVEGWPPTGRSTRPDLIPLLSEVLGDEREELRLEAARTLTMLNHEAALPALLGTLAHEDPAVRREGCRGLGWLGRNAALKPAVLPALRKVCDEDRSGPRGLRFEAAIALARLGELHTADPLVDGLRGYRGESELVAEALVRFGRKDALLLLIQQMALFPDETSRRYGAALEKLTGEKFGEDPVAWYRWFDQNKSRFPQQRQ